MSAKEITHTMSNIWNWAYWAIKTAQAVDLFEEKGSSILLEEDKEYREHTYAPNNTYTRLFRALEGFGEAEGLACPSKQRNHKPDFLKAQLIERLEDLAFNASPWEEAQTVVPRWMRATKRLQREVFTDDHKAETIRCNMETILRARRGTKGGSARHNKWAPTPVPATAERKAERVAKKVLNRAWDRARLSGVGADLYAVLNRVNSTVNNLSTTAGTPELKARSEAAIARLARRAARKTDRKVKHAIKAAIKAAETPKTPKNPKGPKGPKAPLDRSNRAQIAELVAAIKGRLGFDAFIGAIQNSPESTINELSTTAETLSADYKRCLRWVRRELKMSEPRFLTALPSGQLTFTQELRQAFWDRFVRVAQPVGANRMEQINSAFGSAK